MKIDQSAALALCSTILASNLGQSKALKCGIKGITQECLGKTDVRYGLDTSYSLDDQDDFWKSISGLYIGEESGTTKDGIPLSQVPIPFVTGVPEGILTMSMVGAKTFTNFTSDGSRFIYQRYTFFENTNSSLPGFVSAYDAYYASTFEKDGTAELLTLIQLGIDDGYKLVDNSFLIPTVSKALAGFFDDVYVTFYCKTADCSSLQENVEWYEVDSNNVSTLIRGVRGSATKVDTAAWMAGFVNTYQDFNIPPPEAPYTTNEITLPSPFFTQPFDASTATTAPEFYSGIKFTEDDWKIRDPVFGESPYIEPDGILSGGFIAGITIASVIVAFAIFGVVYNHGVKAREKRVKSVVAKSIAKVMTFSSPKDLKPDELEKMFKRIDVDGNGVLSKDEVKGLVEEAGVGDMSAKDYDILFASIDTNVNGTLEFVEFCAFFAAISSDNDSNDDEFNDNTA